MKKQPFCSAEQEHRDKECRAASGGGRFRSPLWGIAAGILLVAGALALLIHFGVQDQVLRLLQWFDTQGAWAALLFVGIMAALVVLVLPGVLLTTGAGFVFGVLEGSIYVVVGTTLGATIAFLVARHLFSQRARQYVTSHTRLKFAIDEMAGNGWKIVLLTRLIPFFPSKIANYFFGLTPVSLRGFVGGSLVGFIPFSIHNVYLGSIAADLATLSARDIGRTPLEWALYGGGFAATIFTIVYLNRLARRRLERYTDGKRKEVPHH